MSTPHSPYDLDDAEEGGSSVPALVRDPVGVLKRGYRWGLVAFLAISIPAVMVATVIPLQYETSSLLMLTAKAIPDQFVPSTIVQTGAQQFEEIRSRVFTRDRLRRIAEAEIEESGATDVSVPELVGTLRGGIQIEQSSTKGGNNTGNETLAIRVGLAGSDPERVASLVNRVTTALIDAHLEFRDDQSQVTLDFMKREFERADQALREHQRKLALFRDRYRGSLPEEQTPTMGRLERLDSQRSSLVLEIADLRSQLNTGGGDSSAPAESGDIRQKLEEELAQLLVLYTDDHPQVQSVRRQLESLGERDRDGDPLIKARRESASQRRQRLEDEIASRSARLREIDGQIAALESNLSQTSEITEEFRALEREEVILQESYGEYLRKLKNAELSRSMETSQKGVQLERVEAAAVPTSPVLPRFLFIAAAVVASFGLGLVMVVLHELLHPVVIDANHLEKLTSVPVLGTIPSID